MPCTKSVKYNTFFLFEASTRLPEKKEKKILLNLWMENTIAKLKGLSVCMATHIEIATPPISSPIREVIVPKKIKRL